MKVLIACEFSGAVRDAFRSQGHDAWSCDLLPNNSEHHYQGGMFEIAESRYWDLIIAHPPCTYLCSSGLHWNKRRPEREQKTIEALEFIQKIWALPCEKLAIENPVGCINSRLPCIPKPQYIQPWQFGHDASKKTGLWKRGLPDLKPTKVIKPRIVNGKKRWSNQTDSGQNKLPPSKDRWKLRAKTYDGIAKAMAEQWG